MTLFVTLLFQTLPLSLADEPPTVDEVVEAPLERFPLMSEVLQEKDQVKKERHPFHVRPSVEVFAAYTNFQNSMRIDDHWGGGGDIKLVGDWGRVANVVLRFGAAAWNTHVRDDSMAYPAAAQVRQYRIGAGMDFNWTKTELGIFINSGAYRFSTKHIPADFVSGETNGFFEIMPTFGFKPAPFLKIGVVGMVTIYSSGFNRPAGSTRDSVNASVGPSLEWQFEF